MSVGNHIVVAVVVVGVVFGVAKAAVGTRAAVVAVAGWAAAGLVSFTLVWLWLEANPEIANGHNPEISAGEDNR